MNPTTPLMTRTMTTPVGTLLLAWNDRGLHAVNHAALEARLSGFDRYLKKNGLSARKAAASDREPYVAALERYFGGETNALADLPVMLLGTPFQLKVWKALQAIPVGSTSSYGELAASIGHPGASRAVGTANGLNPVGIVVPCHRVIAADGSLAGFGGGIDNKRWLLEHEGATVQQVLKSVVTPSDSRSAIR